jgi:excisionase family DNA binding protein
MRNPEDHWLTVEQTAAALRLSTHHVHRHVRRGSIPTATLGTLTVVPREWVDAAGATRTMAASRTRIDWATALEAFNTHNNNSTGTEHALEPLPATAG